MPQSDAGRREILVALGDALANAGRGKEAADAYRLALEGASEDEASDLRRRAADQLFHSGHVDDGLEMTKALVGRFGIRFPKTARRALAYYLVTRGVARMRSPEGKANTSPEESARADLYYSLTSGLCMIDVALGAFLQAAHLRQAIRTGDPYRMARAFALEVPICAAFVKPRKRQKLDRAIERAQVQAERSGEPHAFGLAFASIGFAALQHGEWRKATSAFTRAATYLRQCRGATWELATVEVCSLWALAAMGEFAEGWRRTPSLVRIAEERGDVWASANLTVGMPAMLWLARDLPDEGRRNAERAMAKWSQSGFHAQHCFELISSAQRDLYLGDADGACRRLDAAWPLVHKSMLHKSPILGMFLLDLSGRVHLARALGASPLGRKDLRSAAKSARALQRSGYPWAESLGQLIAGCVAFALGRKEEASGLFARAALGFEASDMLVHAAVAQRRRGENLSGEIGASMVAEADAKLSERVRKPERFLSLLAPTASPIS
jgi:hypothetical protein